MTRERWKRLTELFESALERESAQRAAFLASACGDDPALRHEVEVLLASHEQAGSFGETPAFHIAEDIGGTLDVGSRLGRYEIVALLGAGGMGEVYRARDPQLGREVAIKILRRRGEITHDQLRRFEREARAVGALNHPNILAVYDIGVEAGVPYVVSELLEGETLRARLSGGAPMSVRQSIEEALQIVSGLTAAHAKGIVHRDLKPENLFLTRAGVVKILDFGLAKQTHAFSASEAGSETSLTEQGLVMGTAGYMSPEQVRGQPADARSDVFAFGAVLYEMLTGRRAFTGDSVVETLNAILTMQPPAPSAARPDLSSTLELVVERCLEKDPERRFASMRELGAALEAVPQSIETIPGRRYRLRAAVEDVSPPPAVGHRVVLAVLPFDNLSDDEDQEYFSDGLTDEMIAQLGRWNPQRLGVIARTSAMKYKHTRKGIDVIGRELGASYILEGSVRRSANCVRVTAQLIQVGDQTHLWAQSYDREVGDMLALQSDVAHAIAGEIRVQLTPEERGRLARLKPVDPAAYEAYLKGRYFWNRRTRESLEKSVRYFQKAIEIDPSHVAAYAGLADAYMTQFDQSYLPPREAFALASRAVLDALRLDDTLAEPHTSLGHVRLHQFDWQSAEEQFTRAIELNPGYPTAHYYYANLLAALGRWDKALAEAQRALELDPMWPTARVNRLSILYLARRYDEAIEQVHETIEIDPTYTAVYYDLGRIYERQAKYSEAIDAFHHVSSTGHNRGSTVLAAIGYTHAVAGHRDEAMKVLEQLEGASAGKYVSSYDLALLCLALGDTDRGFALLSKAYDDHSSALPFLNVDARLDGVRSDPRFQALVQRMNFPRGQKASGRHVRVARAAPIAAILLFVAAITATGWFMTSRQQPPSLGGSGRPAVAVMPFDDHSGDPNAAWLSNGLPSMLVTSLAQTPGLDVIGSERLQASLTELGRDASDRSARGEVARHAGAGAMLAGGLFKVGNNIRIDVQLEDLQTGRVVAASSERGQDVFALVDALTAHIRTSLDLEDRPAGRPLRDVTTTSLPAYELYVKGLEAWRNVRQADARTLFEEAVRIDPTFALAHSQLAIVLERLGEAARAMEHRSKAMALLERLPERQRLLVEARQESESNPARALDLAERLIERYPDEEEAYDLMVHIYNRDPAYRKQVLGFMERWARAIPGPGSGHFHNHYGYVLLELGLYTEAEREFRAYIRVSPDEANPYDSLAEFFMLTGRPEKALEHYEQALRLNPLFSSYFGRGYSYAMRGRYEDAVASVSTLEELGPRTGLPAATIHVMNAFIRSRVGRYREAEDHIATGSRLARELGDATAEADFRLLEAVLAWERRQPARAVEAVRRAERATSRVSRDVTRSRQSVLVHLIGGAVDASASHVEAARAHLAAQRELDPGNDAVQLSWQHALSGEIALAELRLAEAESAFRTAEPPNLISPNVRFQTGLALLANNLPFRDGLARVKAARGELKEAIEIYRRLNEPDITSKWTAVLEPRFVLAVARLADRAGDRETARAEYGRFLELWTGADEGLPELAEAKAYIQRP